MEALQVQHLNLLLGVGQVFVFNSGILWSEVVFVQYYIVHLHELFAEIQKSLAAFLGKVVSLVAL